jgi:hypothetical protein
MTRRYERSICERRYSCVCLPAASPHVRSAISPVWRKAHEFILALYTFTAAFPRQETYGLALQMRRAAVSVRANIAASLS